MILLRRLLHASRATILLAILAGFLSGAGSVALLALVHEALAGGAEAALVWAFVGLCGLVLGTKIVSHLLLNRLWQKAVYQLYTDLSRRIVETPLRRLEALGAHRLLTVLTDDVPVIAQALLGVPMLCINLAVVVSCLVFLGWLSSMVLLAILAFLVIGVSTYQLLVYWAFHHLNLARTQQDALMKQFQGLTGGIKELKLHAARREAFLNQLLATADAVRTRNLAGMNTYAIAGSWGHILFFAFLGLLLFGLSRFQEFPTAILTGAALTVLYTAAPLEGILGWLPALGRARVALRNVESLTLALEAGSSAATAERSEPTQISKQQNALPRFLEPVMGVEMVGVTHSYRRENEEGGFLLGPVDLTLVPGEVVFLVGGNGSGKTTLAKVLTGLYEPESGAILLNDSTVTETSREAYRQLFSVVFADYFLFEDFPGLDSAALQGEIQEYLRLLDLDHKVQVRDGRLSTLELSQGQKKRLALLTAFLEDRPIYVFDEWASDQDPRFKEFFYTRLVPELQSRSKVVLVISHDDRYYHTADRLVKLDDGKLVQRDLEYEAVLPPR